MQNYTICIPKPIREHLELKKEDHLILSLNSDGSVSLVKALTKFEDFFGKGKEVFAAVGGGKAYLDKERDAWGK